MGIKRIVCTDFWSDDKVMDVFSPEDKLFFLYLMTNPHTTQLGVYHINKKMMAFELGYSMESVGILIDRFQEYDLIKYSPETSEVAIKNYLKHSIVKGGKPVEDLLEREIKQVKNKSLLRYVYDSLIKDDNLNASVKKIMPLLLNENVNDNDNDNEESSGYKERIVDESSTIRVKGLPDGTIINPKKKRVDLTHINTPDELKAFLRGKQ